VRLRRCGRGHRSGENQNSRNTDVEHGNTSCLCLIVNVWAVLLDPRTAEGIAECLHPEIEERVRSEISTITGGIPVRREHIDSLRYTQQVIQEAMRLYPPAPLIVREAQRVLRVGTEIVEPGTFVYVPVYAIHRHEELWERPDLFEPDRFAPESVAARDRYIYLPFGAGPRICIGMNFALMEATTVLAVVLSSLRLRLRPGYIPQPKLRITLRPADAACVIAVTTLPRDVPSLH